MSRPKPNETSSGFESPRTDEPLFQPSSEVWYKDGNTILIAGDEGFRVYAGMLSEQSSVFADMLEIPLPAPQATHEGCPLVWISDSAVEMRYLLKSMLDPRYILKINQTLDLPALCSILRLSTKYNVVHIRRRAIEALQHYFPTTLSAYYNARERRRLSSGGVSTYFLLANTCREANANVLLPSILYSCSAQQLDTILDGVPDSHQGRVELSHKNKSAVIQSRHQLAHLARTGTLRWLYSGEGCSDKRCVAIRRRVGARLLEGRSIDGFVNPLSTFNDALVELIDGDCCEACQNAVERCVDNGREEVWKKVPSVFGLGSWDVLVKAYGQE
ncbi:hypothetical protein EIP91_007500 [Steccherinum ochraceum]|uniref:BTB domain-containing protein n=1 Tax=Steccherinum ochraceum TaxID=92696 RepID=A0A4R0REQ4_9APHY|nr:hypothetical protein EIP91_007500 [Steccherinum ochraceum]